MYDSILQGLCDVTGVHGTMVIDAAAAVVAHRAHSIYDLTVLTQVARSVSSAVDTIGLIQEDWELVTASFSEGKLLFRSLRTKGGKPRNFVLVVIADSTLNAAFLGVALRVAAAKLVAELESRPPPVPVAASAGASPPPAVEPLNGSAARGSSPGNGSIRLGTNDSDADSDPVSAAFLVACTRALGKSHGPLAKLHVRDAVRKVCGDRPFTRADGAALIALIANTIDDSDDRATFQRATYTL